MGAERLAELCDYRIVAVGNLLDRMEIWQFADGTHLRIRQSGFHANPAAKVLIEDKPGRGEIESSSNVRQKLRIFLTSIAAGPNLHANDQ